MCTPATPCTQTTGGVCALPLLHTLVSASGIANRLHCSIDTPGAAAALCPSSCSGELKTIAVATQVDVVLEHARLRLGGDPADGLFSPRERARWTLDSTAPDTVDVVPVLAMSRACVTVALHVVRCGCCFFGGGGVAYSVFPCCGHIEYA